MLFVYGLDELHWGLQKEYQLSRPFFGQFLCYVIDFVTANACGSESFKVSVEGLDYLTCLLFVG